VQFVLNVFVETLLSFSHPGANVEYPKLRFRPKRIDEEQSSESFARLLTNTQRSKRCVPPEIREIGYADYKKAPRSRGLGEGVANNRDTDKTALVPMHSGGFQRWLLKKIIKDAGLSEDEFRSLL
jgi:hypothetical protein